MVIHIHMKVLDQERYLNYADFKEYFINESKKCNSLLTICMLAVAVTDDSSLFHEVFLFPIKEILTTQIYGYDSNSRTNSISRKMNFDLSVNIDKYKEITNFDIVFIFAHHS